MNTNTCKQCGKEMPDTKQKSAKFCSDDCRMKFHKNGIENFRSINPGTSISTRQIGFVSEMKVAIDLSFRGYEVFNSLYNASCDIIALKEGKMLRIEVKTGFYKCGKLRTGSVKSGCHDVLAIYSPSDDMIHYSKDLD
jgi:hypothetical protein